MPYPENTVKAIAPANGETLFVTNSSGNSMPLSGQVALVTGASRGIGRVIAVALAAEGAAVAVNSIPEDALLAEAGETARQCATHGVRALTVAADVGDYESCQAMAAHVLAEFGRLDILINNAGILRDRTLRKMSREEWDAVINVNLGGCFNTCKAVLEPMVAQEYGRIINLSSVIAHVGNFGQTNYAAAKAGILGFTKSLAREVARHGITVNAVAPGLVDTEMTRSIPEEFRAKILESVPVGHPQTPEEIAQAVVFLARPEQRSITGCCLNVNGGWFMA